jgi:2-oxoglutarate dehydrogenase E1 component
LPTEQLVALHKKYGKAQWYWVQEEPLNMGAASFLKMNLDSFSFGIIARSASASTATGYSKVHIKEQEDLLKKAFAS